jgi:hypothetical protein
MFVLQKLGGHAIAGKETLRITGSFSEVLKKNPHFILKFFIKKEVKFEIRGIKASLT